MRDLPSETSGQAVLCVSESRQRLAALGDTLGSQLPAYTIETTTDPTVVADLVYTRGIDCVVAEPDLEAADGANLQAAVGQTKPAVPVVLASIETTATGDVVVAPHQTETATEDRRLSERIETVVDRQSPSQPAVSDAYADLSTADCPIRRLVEAEGRCEILTALDSQLSALPPVSEISIWTFDSSAEQFTPAGDDPEHREPSATAVAAFETGEPRLTVEPTDDTSLSAEPVRRSAADTATELDVAYPLGTAGVVVATIAGLTPEIRGTLGRLSTVAGACLEHTRAYGILEQRFHRIADRNRTLSQFARTVAHDLNSPLSVIYGRIELSLAEPTNAEMHLQAAMNAAQRVDSLVTDHLQTVETADADEGIESVSVQTVAIQAWRIIDPSMARLQIEPQLGEIEANAIRLQQLFENLIRNAIEHGSEESVGLGSRDTATNPYAVFDDETDSVTITIKPTPAGFAVCDDGPGIPEAERSEIFESGYTTTESGSGLGLHIVSEIVNSHDWEISAAESASGGARFDIEIQ